MRGQVSLPVAAVLTVLCSASVFAQNDVAMMQKSESGIALDSHLSWTMCAPDGVAIGGYDLTSYRQPGGPVAGSKTFVLDHQGATYYFSSAENRSEFQKRPAYYLPAYSGFCAITLALGRVTCPDYRNFKIENDRLLLFEVTGFTNGRTLWNSDADAFRQQADGNFDRLLKLR